MIIPLGVKLLWQLNGLKTDQLIYRADKRRMITSQIIVTFFLTVSALQFDFEGGNIEDHINKKILYLQQFTDEERIGFCKAGDVLSCKILFLKEINDRNASSESIEGYLDLLPDEHRYSGIYLYLTGKWKDIPIEKLKIYMGYLPEELSKGLYNIYLKKLYATGNIKAFMDDYIHGRNAELTSYYSNSMLKRSARHLNI